MLGDEYDDEEHIEYRGLVIGLNADTGEANILPINDQPMFEGENDLWILDVLKDLSYDLGQLYDQQRAKTFALNKDVDVIVN
jgi:hypothetical protein